MDTPVDEKPVADLRNYLAEERTFRAWIRTGVALMGLGVLLARFGNFGDQPRTTQRALSIQPHENSLWLAAALIAVGVTRAPAIWLTQHSEPHCNFCRGRSWI
jgi:putative membrane protein